MGGFIGSHLTKRLLAEGHRVTVVDLGTNKISEFLDHPNLTFIQQDIRNPDFSIDQMVEEADLADFQVLEKVQPEYFYRDPQVQPGIGVGDHLDHFLLGLKEVDLWSDKVERTDDGVVDACSKQLLERVLHAYGIERGFGIPRVFSFFMYALIRGTTMQLVDGGEQQRCYTYIDDAVEGTWRIIENPGGVCDRQIFNLGSPYNEISIRQLAETMRDIYAAQFRDPLVPLPEIVSVPGETFYGKGYEDSNRRIPDISKARTLLEWEPVWPVREMLEVTMSYYVHEYPRTPIAVPAA